MHISHHFHHPTAWLNLWLFSWGHPECSCCFALPSKSAAQAFFSNLGVEVSYWSQYLKGALVNLASWTLCSSPILTIGCQVSTNSPRLPHGIPRLPMLIWKNHFRGSGNISSMVLNVANPSSPLSRMPFLDALVSTLLSATGPCKALAPLSVKIFGLALHNCLASADCSYSLNLVSYTPLYAL